MCNKRPFSDWELISELGSGGNGTVWKARRNGVECALKILKKRNVKDESFKRFVSEVEVLQKLGNHPGILPILDSSLPEAPAKKNPAWLSMPLARGIKVALGDRPKVDEVVQAVGSVAKTLAALAKKGISHRDIKPENLYRFEDNWAIGDFGLADFPEKDDITTEGRALGPRFYIAPEMVRFPHEASGFPADVFSLAKTMWVLSSGQNFPPPGHQLASDLSDALAILTDHPRAFLLDRLIERSTSKEPTERLDMDKFAEDLAAWIILSHSPVLETDVSDVTNLIKSNSTTFFDNQNTMQKSNESAIEMNDRLMNDLEGLSETLSETDLKYNKPQKNGGNLLSGSGLDRTNHGTHGVTVSMYTPSSTTHIFECGVCISVLDDGRHRLYAAHHIRPHGLPIEVVWSDVSEVDFGSSLEIQLLDEMVQGLYSNLRSGLERFNKIISSEK